jgi:predicted MFS family arabinose efflux permease
MSVVAGVSGLLAAPWMDRFDRRTALLVLYAGFGLSTLACALAPTYGALLGARFAAGAFGRSRRVRSPPRPAQCRRSDVPSLS